MAQYRQVAGCKYFSLILRVRNTYFIGRWRTERFGIKTKKVSTLDKEKTERRFNLNWSKVSKVINLHPVFQIQHGILTLFFWLKKNSNKQKCVGRCNENCLIPLKYVDINEYRKESYWGEMSNIYLTGCNLCISQGRGYEKSNLLVAS